MKTFKLYLVATAVFFIQSALAEATIGGNPDAKPDVNPTSVSVCVAGLSSAGEAAQIEPDKTTIGQITLTDTFIAVLNSSKVEIIKDSSSQLSRPERISELISVATNRYLQPSRAGASLALSPDDVENNLLFRNEPGVRSRRKDTQVKGALAQSDIVTFTIDSLGVRPISVESLLPVGQGHSNELSFIKIGHGLAFVQSIRPREEGVFQADVTILERGEMELQNGGVYHVLLKSNYITEHGMTVNVHFLDESKDYIVTDLIRFDFDMPTAHPTDSLALPTFERIKSLMGQLIWLKIKSQDRTVYKLNKVYYAGATPGLEVEFLDIDDPKNPKWRTQIVPFHQILSVGKHTQGTVSVERMMTQVGSVHRLSFQENTNRFVRAHFYIKEVRRNPEGSATVVLKSNPDSKEDLMIPLGLIRFDNN